MQNKIFGRLVKIAVSTIAINEGKAAVAIEDELGHLTGVTGASIQRYKNGHIPPNIETIKILASAGISRGFLSREWTESLLRESDYPHPAQLIEELFPASENASSRKRTYNNLPAPFYSQFIARPAPYREVVDGLSRRSAVVLIISLGGFGKSSLAREIAERSLSAHSDVPKFEAAVWISDKGKEGTTNLNIVLDEIAYTLEYAGITGLPFKDKKREVEKLLRYHRTLLIIDNAETITDSSLIHWLIDLPEPSKSIITTRERNEVFFNNTTWIKLKGMDDTEAKEFIAHHLQLLQFEKMADDQISINTLISATGGNPKAMKIALGYIKHRHQSLPLVLDELLKAKGEIFDDLFRRCWELLSAEAQHLLVSLSFFPCGANPDALAEVSDIKGQGFQKDIERLADLSLVDVQHDNWNSPPLYTLHQLVLAFALSQKKENPKYETDTRERWISRYRGIASKIGFAWKDLDRLKLLDDPGESETMLEVIEWCFSNGRFKEVIEISKNSRYYFYVRGFWSNERSINLLRAEAARQTEDRLEEFDARVYHINIASKQANFDEIEKHLPRLQEMLESNAIPAQNMTGYRHAMALFLMQKGDHGKARALLEENLASTERLSEYDTNVNKRWSTFCLLYMGKFSEAEKIFTELIDEARAMSFKRGIVSARIGLIQAHFNLQKLDALESELDDAMEEAIDTKDQMYIGQICSLYGDYFSLKQDRATALEYYNKAVETYRRLGHTKRQTIVEEKRERLLSQDLSNE